MGWDMLPHPRDTKTIEYAVAWSAGDSDSGLFVGSPSKPRNADTFPHIDIVLTSHRLSLVLVRRSIRAELRR